MTKYFLFPLAAVLLLAGSVRANMASPFDEGTLGASPFISLYVDILSENIRIVPDERFETARFLNGSR